MEERRGAASGGKAEIADRAPAQPAVEVRAEEDRAEASSGRATIRRAPGRYTPVHYVR